MIGEESKKEMEDGRLDSISHPRALLYIHQVRVSWVLISICASSAGLEKGFVERKWRFIDLSRERFFG
jgi:hypothetical protein